MTLIDSLRSEFAHEAKTTRTHLERLVDDKLGWRPHPKSFTAGELASHIVENIAMTAPVFTADELNFDMATYRPYNAASVAELLEAFDAGVASGTQALDGITDAHLARPWRMKVNGKVHFERPKGAVFRDFTLNHVIHHRGQFSVYLRLMDIPVPGSYGPTADE